MEQTIPKILEKAYYKLPSTHHGKTLKVYQKGIRMAASVAVGETFRVRIDRKRVQSGRILAARVHRLLILPQGVRVLFEVDMECGVDKVFKQVLVSKIPTNQDKL